jgi:arabinose-5-phosphate isomerase
LSGIITDGDLRRTLETKSNIWELEVKQVMSTDPKTVTKGVSAIEAFKIMQQRNIMQVVVVDDRNRPVGMIHLHDFLEAGVS